MNANLRGDVKLMGMPIKDYIKMVASGTPSSLNPAPVTEEKSVDVDAIIAKRMQPLDAFQDEKKIMSDALTGLLERVKKLEAAATEAPAQVPPPVDFKPDIDALTASVEKLEKKVVDVKPRRGVDQATLDTAMAHIENTIHSKIEGVATEVSQLRKELEV